MKKIGLVIIAVILLAACNSGNDIALDKLDEKEVSKTTDEAIKGDFIYRLITEKDEYAESEEVNIYAELEYVGEKDEIEIFHAASPFYFPIKEKVRNYDIGYAMNEPLINTTLRQGEPLREEYVKNGGYSDQDEDDYVAFMKRFLNMNEFPIGHYVINGYADFYIEASEDGEEKEDFRIEGQIDFKVIE